MNIDQHLESDSSVNRIVQRIRETNKRVQRHPASLFVAFVLFLAATVFAYNRIPISITSVRWGYVVAAALAVPGLVVVNGIEYRYIGSVLGVSVSWTEAVRVSLLGTAANVLPLPGAALVRTGALTDLGIALRSSASATAAIGAAWVGVAASVSGPLLLALEGQVLTGLAISALGLSTLAAAAFLLRTSASSGEVYLAFRTVVLIELVVVALGAIRFYVALQAIGVELSPMEAVTFALASALASATGIFPGGLGIRELLSGFASDVVGLTMAAGVLASAINRVIELAVLAPITVGLMLHSRKRHQGAHTDLHAKDGK